MCCEETESGNDTCKISITNQAFADFLPILLKVIVTRTTVANYTKFYENPRIIIVLIEFTKSLCNFSILDGIAVGFTLQVFLA